MGISPRQFKELEERLRRTPRAAKPVFETVLQMPSGARHQVILGLDPSLRGTGYGVIRRSRPHPDLLAQGTISCPASWERSRCLVRISQTLREVLKQCAATVCIVESLFYAQNMQTAMILGEARGAALAVAAESGLEIFEFAPRKVKQAVVGYGAAQKLAVAKMVQRMLCLNVVPAPDAADALALALVYAQENGRYGLDASKRV